MGPRPDPGIPIGIRRLILDQPLFLSGNEIHELTGYMRPADQVKWLKARGWKFETSAVGRPVVLRAFAQAQMGKATDDPPPWTPNLAALQKAA